MAKKKSSHNQPRAKGKFASKNLGKHDDSAVAMAAPLTSITDASNSLRSSSRSSGTGAVDNTEASTASSALPELSSSEGDVLPPIDGTPSDHLVSQQDDETPPMSLYAVTEKWGRRLRPRDEDGKVIYSHATEAILVEKIANISLENTESDDALRDPGSESDNSSSASTERAQTGSIDDTLEWSIAAGELDDALEMANDVLRSDELCQLEDLKDAREAVKNLSKTRHVLAKYKEGNPDIQHVGAVSFSKLTWKHLENMGVGNVELMFSDMNFLQKINRVFNTKSEEFPIRLSEKFPQFWYALIQNKDYIELFEIILGTVGEKSEARARLLTDLVVLRVLMFLKKELSLVPLLFLELTLSAANDLYPVVIVHKERATFITGSVDYAIFSSVSRAEELGMATLQDRVGKLIKQSTLENILKQDKQGATQLAEMNYFKFTIIEEKRKDHTGRKLVNCVPQVVGEALAILQKMHRGIVPWCISNGEEWLFGVVTMEGLTKEPRTFRLPILSLRETSRQSDLEVVFKLLIIWTAFPDRMILRHFFQSS